MSDVRLTYTDVEAELRSAVRRLLADREDLPAQLVAMEHEVPHDGSTWKALDEEMGLSLLVLPEEIGGAGAGAHELGVVMEEIGHHLAPVPFLGHAALAAGVVARLGSPALVERFTRSTPTAVAVPVHRAWFDPFPEQVRWSGEHLDGAVDLVLDATHATTLLLPAVSDDGPVLVLCDAAAAARARVAGFDLTRDLSRIDLDGVPGEVVARGDAARVALTAGTHLATAALACEQVGIAERALELAVEHARARMQFGRAVGSFQAVKHRLADAWVAVTQARAAARNAVDAVARDDDVALALAVASIVTDDAAVLAAETCVQAHGGLGFSWEHPAHLFLKRARANMQAFGSAEAHLDLVADLADLPAPHPNETRHEVIR